LAVVELDARPQLDGPRHVVGTGVHRLGEVRNVLAVLVRHGQGVVHRRGDGDPRDRQLGVRQAEVRGRRLEAVGDRPARLRLPTVLRRRGSTRRADRAQGGAYCDHRSQRHSTNPPLARHISVRIAHSRPPNPPRPLRPPGPRRSPGRLTGQSGVTAATLGALAPMSTAAGALTWGFAVSLRSGKYRAGQRRRRCRPSLQSRSLRRRWRGTMRWLRVTGTCAIPLDELEWRFSGPGGPGGQHANTSNTRVEVRLDVARSPSLSESQRARLMERLGPVVRIVARREALAARNRGAGTAPPARAARRRPPNAPGPPGDEADGGRPRPPARSQAAA